MNAVIDISRVTLKTERLFLRPFQKKDAADLFAYASMPGVGPMAGWKPHESIQESEERIDHFIAEKKTFALEYQGKVIGSLGIEVYNEKEYPDAELKPLRGREIGYVLSQDYWGLGLMTEAVREVLKYLFTVEQMDFVTCGHFAKNRRSARVQEKCGFRFYGVAPYETQMGAMETSVNSLLTREEWLNDQKKQADQMLRLIESRGSYRGKYLPNPVPQEDLTAILRCGLAAPSGCNKQTVSLIAVDDPALLRRLHEVIRPSAGETAPAMICVLSKRIIAYRDRCFATQDYAAAIENMLLAAEALGYKSCWYEGHITDTDRIGNQMAKILGVPADYELVCFLPIGLPEGESPKALKKPFRERAWLNGFFGEK